MRLRFCLLLMTLLFFAGAKAPAQGSLPGCYDHARLNKKGMLALGGWSLLNAGYSGLSLLNATGQNKAFHQMGLGWSAVNLGLAIPFYLKAKKDLSTSDLSCKPGKHRRIFLFNTFLDLAYMGTGIFLMNPKKTADVEKAQRAKGFGSSILLQGSFLFTFDLYMFFAHRRVDKKAG